MRHVFMLIPCNILVFFLQCYTLYLRDSGIKSGGKQAESQSGTESDSVIQGAVELPTHLVGILSNAGYSSACMAAAAAAAAEGSTGV